MLPVADFKEQYLSWLRQETETLTMSSGTVRLTVPFLDIDNDYLEIYIQNSGGKLLLTDGGETISNLEFSNFRMSEKRRAILHSFVASNGVALNKDNSLSVECTNATFGMKANSLMQCMIKVSDMLILSESNIKTLFTEDVKAFLDENEIFYIQNVSFAGKSSFYATYDFVVPPSKSRPESYIVPINYPKENIIKTTIFTWEDVKAARPNNCTLYAVLNDTDRAVPPAGVEALKQYGIQCIPWSQRDHIAALLSA